MLIRTRHFSVVGLPWSGIRSFARAFAERAPDDWDLKIVPSHRRSELRPFADSPVAALVSHPVQWFRDLWLHRTTAEAVSLGAEDERDFERFCQAQAGAYSRNLIELMGGPPEDWPRVRAENFNHDIRRALAPWFTIPEEVDMFPALREPMDELAERPICSEARSAAAIIAAGDPLLGELGYRLDSERCGDIT